MFSQESVFHKGCKLIDYQLQNAIIGDQKPVLWLPWTIVGNTETMDHTWHAQQHDRWRSGCCGWAQVVKWDYAAARGQPRHSQHDEVQSCSFWIMRETDRQIWSSQYVMHLPL